MPRTTHDDPEVFPRRGDERQLLRLVRSALTSEADWQSNYERGDPPRKSEIASALDHMGLSMWDRPEPLISLSRQWPKLGTFMAEVRLVGELGIWFAETGPEGHFIVWGRPADLQRCAGLRHYPV